MKNLYAKLLLAQEEIKSIKKDSTNPHFKNTYFDINTLIDAVKPVLTIHGIILIQPIREVNGRMCLFTLLIHAESGEELSSSMILPENIDPQKMGSAITYYRRYAIQSMLLIEAEDDDGNTSTPAPRPPRQENTYDDGNTAPPPQYKKPVARTPLTPEQQQAADEHRSMFPHKPCAHEGCMADMNGKPHWMRYCDNHYNG